MRITSANPQWPSLLRTDRRYHEFIARKPPNTSAADPMTAPIDMHQAQLDRASNWGRVFLVMITVGLVGLLARVVQLKLSPDPRLAPALGSYTSSHIEMGRRGDLLDRKGRVIATSSVGYRLFIDPKIVADPSTIAVDLGRVLQMNPIEIDHKLV